MKQLKVKSKDRKHYLPESRIRYYIYQVLLAIDHMHRNGIFHRDIKPENLLIIEDKLKLADFGSCRGIFSKQPYTEYISTRWYRPPECLLTDGYYNYKMDLWGVGCVLFEIISLFPLFPGNNELDQVHKIHNILGTPPKDLLDKLQKFASHMDLNFAPKVGTGLEKLIPQTSSECLDLISQLLTYDPDKRISARKALKHPYLKDLYEADKRKLKIRIQSIKPNARNGKNSKKPKKKNNNSNSSKIMEDTSISDEINSEYSSPNNKMEKKPLISELAITGQNSFKGNKTNEFDQNNLPAFKNAAGNKSKASNNSSSDEILPELLPPIVTKQIIPQKMVQKEGKLSNKKLNSIGYLTMKYDMPKNTNYLKNQKRNISKKKGNKK